MKQLPINTLYRRERVVSVAHSLQMMCEANPELTITSVDGVSAFDLISRRAMLEGLGSVEGGPAAFSFVHMFCGRPSTYLWEDAEGTVHTINQGEGSEQRDALMPLLFSLGQHSGLEATHRQLRVNTLFRLRRRCAHCVEARPCRGSVHQSRGELVWPCSHSDPHGQDTHGNQLGVEPPVCAALQRAAEVVNPHARVWRGSCPPTNRAFASWVLQWATLRLSWR